MEYGAKLTDDNVIEAPWESSIIPEGAFTSKAELLKDGARAALASMERNEPILSSRITGPNQPASLAALTEPGMCAVSVRVDEARGVAGFVRMGDRVDVIMTRSDTDNQPGSFHADVLLYRPDDPAGANHGRAAGRPELRHRRPAAGRFDPSPGPTSLAGVGSRPRRVVQKRGLPDQRDRACRPRDALFDQPVPPGKQLKTQLDTSLAGNDIDYFLNGQPEVPKTPPFTSNPFGGCKACLAASRRALRSPLRCLLRWPFP